MKIKKPSAPAPKEKKTDLNQVLQEPYDAARSYNEFLWKQSYAPKQLEMYRKVMPASEAMKQALRDIGEYHEN